jgi:hypothetical protein
MNVIISAYLSKELASYLLRFHTKLVITLRTLENKPLLHKELYRFCCSEHFYLKAVAVIG